MKKLPFLFVAFTGFLLSCSNEEPVSVLTKQSEPITSNRVSLNKALESASTMFNSLEGVSTRSNNRVVDKVDVLTRGMLTRSEGGDTLLYVVNYADNGGFAVLGADIRLPAIYAIAEDGHFEITDETNDGLKVVMARAEADAKSRIDNNPGIETLGFGDFNGGNIGGNILAPKLIKKISPYLGERQNRIGVDNCSKFTVNSQGEPALTGCVPIAVEMIMSHYKWPRILSSYQFDWDKINAGEDEDGLARIVAILSDKDHCNLVGNTMTNVGGALPSDAISTLEKCGYERPAKFKHFFGYEEEAQAYLENGPLLMHAYSPEESMHNGVGHMWVIDGLAIYSQTTTEEVWSGTWQLVEKESTLYHCVWGCGGTTNGYYLVAEQGFDGVPNRHDPIDNGDDSGYLNRLYENTSVVFLGNFVPKFVFYQ